MIAVASAQPFAEPNANAVAEPQPFAEAGIEARDPDKKPKIAVYGWCSAPGKFCTKVRRHLEEENL